MILIADLHVADKEHIIVNSSIINLIKKIYPDEKLVFFAEKNHIKNVQKMINFDNIEFISQYYHCDGEKIKIFFKELIEIIYLIYLFMLAWKRSPLLFIITSILPITHLFLKLFKKIFPQIKLLIILHGELEFMRGNKKINMRIFGSILRKSLIINNDNHTKYLIFGESVKRNLIELIKKNEKNFICIDHPYPYSQMNSYFTSSALRIGTIGIANVYKNSQYIFELGNTFKNEIKKGNLKFTIIGKIDDSISNYVNNWVEYFEHKTLLSRELFEQSIQRINYAIFFYDNNYYKLCSSGAIFDAIQFEKPIIAIKNDFFQYYFDKLGNIGYLCNDFEEIRTKIKEILAKKPIDEYSLQISNLKKAKEVLSLATLKVELEKQLLEYGMK